MANWWIPTVSQAQHELLFSHKILTAVPWNLYNYLLHVTCEETENQVTEVIFQRLTADWWQSPEPAICDVGVLRNHAPCKSHSLQRFWCDLPLLGFSHWCFKGPQNPDRTMEDFIWYVMGVKQCPRPSLCGEVGAGEREKDLLTPTL